MPPHKARQQGITRPRPSLSCVVCKRRKVRCGKEQPFCSNCAKAPEECKYEHDFHRRSTEQIIRKFPSVTGISEGEESSESRTSKDHSLDQSVLRSFPPVRGPTSYVETDTVVDRHHSANADQLLDSYSLHERNSIRSRHSPGTLDQSRDSLFPQPRDRRNSSQGVPTWNSDTSLQWIDQPLNRTPSLDPSSEEQRKRRRIAEARKIPQSLETWQTQEQEAAAPRPQVAKASDQLEAALRCDEDIRPSGFLSMQRGGLSRFVGDAFWGHIVGHGDLCEGFLAENHHIPENVPLPHIDTSGLAVLLTTIPNRIQCDALIKVFSINVHPLHPLIHLPSFRRDYSNYWQWCRNSDISMPDNRLLDDPTFFCLMFSILYCGVSASTPEIWTNGDLRDLDREKTAEDLRKTYSTSLKMCQHLQYPTLSTLASSILAHSCTKPNATYLEDLGFVHMTVRIAQSMGLHRDGSSFGLDALNCEMRRRLWWHVVWLDVQTNVLHGSPLFSSLSEVHTEVAMVSVVQDQDLSSRMTGLASRGVSPPSAASSVAMLLAQGRYETAKFKRSMAERLNSGGPSAQARLELLVQAAKNVQGRLDHIIGCIPTQAQLEKGFVPSEFADASPLTHEWLYSDTTGQATVFGAWAKLNLVMLKTEIAISVLKPFIVRADSGEKQQQSMWDSIVQLSLSYLQYFMQLMRVPAFAPYSWLCKNSCPPLQQLFLVLVYLQYHRELEGRKVAIEIVDGVIDMFNLPVNHSIGDRDKSDGVTPHHTQQKSLAWRALTNLRHKLDLPLGMERSAYEPVAPIKCTLISPDIALHTRALTNTEKSGSHSSVPAERHSPNNVSALNLQSSLWTQTSVHPRQQVNGQGVPYASNRLDTSDLDTWCSSLIEDPGASFS